MQVLVNSDGTEDGTLLKLLGRCMTPSGSFVWCAQMDRSNDHAVGKRLFRIWLCMPLRQAEDINARYDFSHECLVHPEMAFTGWMQWRV